MRELAQLALDSATRAGASYADVRVIQHRRQQLSTEDERVSHIRDAEEAGIGVRVLVSGAWGFAGTGVLERGEVDSDGTRHFLLRLADTTGGRELWGVTLKESTSFPDEGDLVGFRIVKIAPDLPAEVSIIGFIAVKLAPEFLEKKGWRVVASYTPENIRKTVRW